MLDTTLLSSIAKQLMTGTEVDVQGKSIPVRRTMIAVEDCGESR